LALGSSFLAALAAGFFEEERLAALGFSAAAARGVSSAGALELARVLACARTGAGAATGRTTEVMGSIARLAYLKTFPKASLNVSSVECNVLLDVFFSILDTRVDDD
jgi:hypothetical protein